MTLKVTDARLSPQLWLVEGLCETVSIDLALTMVLIELIHTG